MVSTKRDHGKEVGSMEIKETKRKRRREGER